VFNKPVNDSVISLFSEITHHRIFLWTAIRTELWRIVSKSTHKWPRMRMHENSLLTSWWLHNYIILSNNHYLSKWTISGDLNKYIQPFLFWFPPLWLFQLQNIVQCCVFFLTSPAFPHLENLAYRPLFSCLPYIPPLLLGSLLLPPTNVTFPRLPMIRSAWTREQFPKIYFSD